MPKSTTSPVLVVEDDPFIRKALGSHLSQAGYDPVLAEDGAAGWLLLEQDPSRFSTVLLDRTMPRMDGMEVLTRIKAHESLGNLPVIMQTARGSKEEVLEGLEAGAYYYLTKPVAKKTLLALVKSAVSDHHNYEGLREKTRQVIGSFALMRKGAWAFRTLAEGQVICTLLAHCCPDPERVVTGLSELITNAVEHGNLGITYDDKSRLMAEETWQAEIERRLALPENREKYVHVEVERKSAEVHYRIEDQGKGFNWRKYIEFSPERAFDTHGRGIAMSRHMSFDHLEYQGSGNTVRALVNSDTPAENAETARSVSATTSPD